MPRGITTRGISLRIEPRARISRRKGITDSCSVERDRNMRETKEGGGRKKGGGVHKRKEKGAGYRLTFDDSINVAHC